MDIELVYFDDCPNWKTAAERLDSVLAERNLAAERVRVESPDQAEAAGLRGSPTIRFDGTDPFATGDEPHAFACRIYSSPDGPAGAPTVEQLRKALDRHLDAHGT